MALIEKGRGKLAVRLKETWKMAGGIRGRHLPEQDHSARWAAREPVAEWSWEAFETSPKHENANRE